MTQDEALQAYDNAKAAEEASWRVLAAATENVQRRLSLHAKRDDKGLDAAIADELAAEKQWRAAIREERKSRSVARELGASLVVHNTLTGSRGA